MRFLSVLVFMLVAVVASAKAAAEAPPVPVGSGAWLSWEYQHPDPESQGLYEGAVVACVTIMTRVGAVELPPSTSWREIFDTVGRWLVAHHGYDDAPLDMVVYTALVATYGEPIQPMDGRSQ